MAQVEWSAGIDSVSGALSKPSKTGHHSCAKMLLGTHRVAETTNNVCNRLYIRKPVKRSTPVSADELEIRLLFTQRQAWVNARNKNLSTMSSDQLNFNAQKDQPGGAKTWKAYLWKLAKAAVTLNDVNNGD